MLARHAIDWFLAKRPPPAEDVASVDEERRARILVGGSLAGLAVCLVFFVQRLAAHQAGPRVWVMAVSAIVFAGPSLMLRRGLSLRAASLVVPVAMLGLLPFDAYENGGLAAASLTAMLVVPPMGGFFLGGKWAFVFAAVLEVELVALVVLASAGFVFPPGPDPAQATAMHVVAVGALLVFMTGSTALFDRQRAMAMTRVLESERRYAATAMETNDGMFDLDVAANTVTVSGRYARLVGRDSRATLTFSEFVESIHRADRERFVAAIDGLRAGGNGFVLEYRSLQAPGEYRWLDGRAHASRSSDGALRALGTVRDITQKVKLERLKSEFISTVSHELRTPLTSIRGSLGLLAGGVFGDMPREARECLEIASSNSVRLLRIVDDLLDMQKLEAGLFELTLADADLAAIAVQCIEANRGYAAEHGANLRLTRPATETPVHVDANRMLQVLANLVSNASKFSSPGGIVDVVVGLRGERARVDVIDHGRGIAPEFRPRLFTRFAQEEPDGIRKGTGLGLSIVKSLVEQMGGEVEFEPTPGGGSTFSVTLPAARRSTDGVSRALEPGGAASGTACTAEATATSDARSAKVANDRA